MVLEGRAFDAYEFEHPDELVTEWSGDGDVPREWREMVDGCMSRDPNGRPRLVELADFRRKEMGGWNDATQLGIPCSSDDG